MKKILLISLSIMRIINRVIIFYILFFVVGCSAIETTIIESRTSPDNKYVAVIFQKDGGATTDFNRQVSILKKQQKRIRKANTFIMIGTDAEIEWVSEDCLEIRYSGKVILQSEKINGVKIIYNKKEE